MKKRLLSLILALGLCLSLALPAGAADNSIQQVEAGYLFSLILTKGGDLYGCGLPYAFGDTVTQTDGKVPTPQKITDGVVKVAASKDPSSQAQGSFVSGGHTLILKEGGSLYGLGENSCGQLGQGDRQEHPGLQYIMDDVADISCTATASFAVTTNGDLYWWGLLMEQNNFNAQYRFEPSPVKVLSDVAAVDGGREHVVALKKDGTVWTMGSAYDCALGDGAAHGFSPTFIQAFSGAKQVSAGNSFTLALMADGSLWGWGSNSCGQLGLDFVTTLTVAAPTLVMTDVKDMTAGHNSTHAIKTDGSLWSAGWNYHGELGLGESLKETACTATFHKTLTGVSQVSAGYLHTLALKSDGTMYGCGQNHYYEFGTGVAKYAVYDWIPAGFTAVPLPGITQFFDVPSGAYYEEPVRWAVEKGITSGTGATTFSPEKTCSRAEIVTFLWRSAGSPEPRHMSPIYTDVTDSTAYYYKAVLWAGENALVENDTFDPNDPCTRSAAVYFLWKAAGSPSAPAASFADVPTGADYTDAVSWAVANGVTNGTGDGAFSPDATCTRAQIVTFLYRAEG